MYEKAMTVFEKMAKLNGKVQPCIDLDASKLEQSKVEHVQYNIDVAVTNQVITLDRGHYDLLYKKSVIHKKVEYW